MGKEYFENCGCQSCKKAVSTAKKQEFLRKEFKIGDYAPLTIKGKLIWDVKTGKGSGFFCEKQEDAEILSWLVRIGKKLNIEED
jgi:hypothetical protein